MASQSTSPPTEPLPSEKDLSEAATHPIFAADGKSRQFSSLYDDTSKQTLIIFIRHFYCGDCQDYIRSLTASITPQELTTAQKRLYIIGCGEHSVIANYVAATGCPFDIYTDATGTIYSLLGMGRSLTRGPKPEYIQRSLAASVFSSIKQELGWGMPLKGGDIQRIGGEWYWEGGRLVWCHRMKNTRDHLEVLQVRTVLGLSSE